MTSVLRKKRERDAGERPWGGRAWSDAAIGQETPRAGRGEEGPSLGAFGESVALLTLRFWTSGLRNRERIKFCFLGHPVCGNL